MNETQLFYLTIMLAMLILYLVVCKICEAYEIKYKALAMSNIKITDISDNEELKNKIMEAIEKETNRLKEENNNGRE